MPLAAPFAFVPGTTVPSMMMGPIPIQSVPPSTNPLYGNQFGNGLFPSNPFQWSMGGLGSGSPTSQLTLPPLPPIGAISSASSTPSTGLEFAPVSMTSANRTTSQRSDPTNLLNGLSNGNKLPDDVKPDTLVKELLVWSQTMSQLQQTQKSQGTAENHPIHCMTQSKSTELMEGVVVASPVDEFSQSDCYDGGSGGDPNSVKSSTNPIRKYGSFEECSSIKCQSAGMREHYHCQSCEKIIVRREEMIRHAKWHRKREESLQYGFMRYSPGDNCAVTGCAHNGRQTHYHCLQPNCTKVYISTSDVQMHANFHRKDAVIIQEGFQRFRASENCGVQICPFYQERTTHFHCRRPNCRFTFKNKADMEKHKLHHQKNDNFAKDGFRKFIKCETCGFANCKYSGIINHIHCIRPGCDYVVHSSSQILSHKRKHDRRFSHLTPRHSDPAQFTDLSNLTFDSALRADPNVSQSNPSPYDLSPGAADFGEPLDMKCYPLSAGKQEDEALTPRTPSENSPFASGPREMLSPVQDLTSQISDKVYRKANCLFEKCLNKRKESSVTFLLPGNCNEEEEKRTLRILFPQQHVCSGDIDEDWKIEGENTEEVEHPKDAPDSDIHLILRLVHQFHEHQTGNEDADDEDANGDNPSDHNKQSNTRVSDPAISNHSSHFCIWPKCATEPVLDISNDLNERHSIREDDDDDDDDGDDDDDNEEDADKVLFCPHWSRHVWQASVLKCGLSSCTMTDSSCPNPPEDPHMHCCFWPACAYKVRLCDKDPFEPFSHLVSHEARFARPSVERKRLDTLSGRDINTSRQSVSPNQPSGNISFNEVNTNPCPLAGHQPRRRGRPPKYTKYIRVPRPQLPDELCTDNCAATDLTRDMFFTERLSAHCTSQVRIVGGVKLYITNEQCPDDLCDYSIQRVEHYHCVRPRCYMASESLDLMNVHRREFHNHVKIAPGFEHFDRSVDCRRPTCHSKRMNQHYHCTYPNCDYAFIRPSTMLQHARKHEEVARARRLGLNHLQKHTHMLNRIANTDRLSVRQVAMDQLTKPMGQVEKPPFLPLGLSSLVAAQLPTIFPPTTVAPNEQTHCTGGSIDSPGLTHMSSQSAYPQNSLPGFLPIWAAAMAAAAAVAKQANGWPEGLMDHRPESNNDRYTGLDSATNGQSVSQLQEGFHRQSEVVDPHAMEDDV